MATERSNDERYDRPGNMVEENKQGMSELGIEMGNLRENNALLAQMLVEEREAKQEFSRTVNAKLEKIDRTLEELRRDRDNRN